MPYQKIIDIHNHIYPKKIAQKAISNIGKFYNVPMNSDKGAAEDLLESGSQINVEKYVVHAVSTTVHQVSAINDFIADECSKHKEFIGYATLHPDMTNGQVEKEIERVLKKGFKGIKLHPDFQRFDIDDKKADKIYDIAQDTLPILFHTGDDRFDYSSPERLAKTAKKFPKLKCIAAHFGGYTRWSEIDVYDGIENVFFDTSSSLFKLPDLMAKDILKHLGYEKFMFGTDFPMWTHKEELQRFLKLGLKDSINEDILYNNAKRILEI